jgi:hypothetical protein
VLNVTSKRRINYVGWLGYKNLGDEALYEVISQLLNSYQLLPSRSSYEDHSIFSPVTIIGGSTGIPEWFENFRPTTYNYIFGAGVKDPTFVGYDYIFNDHKKVRVMFEKLKAFRYIGVRGNFSKALLLRRGIRSEVVGDPCLSLKPTIPHKKNETKIAISIGSDGILWGMDERLLFHEIAKVCRNLKRDGFEPILIPFWENNVMAVENLAKQEKVDFFSDWFNVESTLNLIANSFLFIGQKLHSLVFSAAAGTPFISLEYQPKCYDFTQSVGFENYSIRTDIASEERIMTLVASLIGKYDEMRTVLKENVDFYRSKQKTFAYSILQDMDTLPEHLWHRPSFQRRTRNAIFWKAEASLRRRTPLWYVFNRLLFKNLMRFMT